MTTLAFVLAAMAHLAPQREHLEIGRAIAIAVDDARPLFAADEDRHKTAALVVAIAFRESTFRNDAVSKTDDFCFLQVHRRPDLADDPEACARVGLEMIRVSLRACPAHPLAVYAEGPNGCASPRAQRISRDRFALAARLLRFVHPTAGDPR